jgi:hypothetical protein
MIYLIGGAPRTGKTILGQSISAKRNVSWISTDLLIDLLRLKNEDGVKASWNAAPEAIAASAEWFFPYLERFVWGVSSQTEDYLIEGADFLPAQVTRLSAKYSIRAAFIGCSQMTLECFDQFPGRSRGYASLPEALRRQIVQDVPRWSNFIRQEADRLGYPYVDMAGDFTARLNEAEAIFTL